MSDSPQPAPAPSEPPASPGKTPTKVLVPAILLIIIGALNLLWSGYGMMNNLIAFGEPRPEVQVEEGDDREFDTQLARDLDNSFLKPLEGFNDAIGPYGREFNLAMSCVAVLFAGLIVLGGIQMARLKSRRLAMLASILACVPCLTVMGCCGLGQGVGIYAFVILLNADVKAMFT